MAREQLDLLLKEKDSLEFTVTVTEDHLYDNDSDTVVDLTGWTPKATIKRSENSEDADSFLPFRFIETGFADGEVTLILDSAYTQDLDTLYPLGEGVWDLQLSSPDATPLRFTPFYGDVDMNQDVTHLDDPDH